MTTLMGCEYRVLVRSSRSSVMNVKTDLSEGEGGEKKEKVKSEHPSHLLFHC